MKHWILTKALQVICISTICMNSIGLAQAGQGYKLYRHELNISGVLVKFYIPENFSKDFPSDDIIKNINIHEPINFSEFDNKALLNRYWDFETDGFFSKEVGTIQLNISVFKARSGGDIGQLPGFINAIVNNLDNMFFEGNKKKKPGGFIIYSNGPRLFVEKHYNDRRWLEYTYGTEDERELTICYAVPVSEDGYLSFMFSLAPRNNVRMRGFIEEYSREFVDSIMSSVFVVFPADSAIEKKMIENSNIRLEDLQNVDSAIDAPKYIE